MKEARQKGALFEQKLRGKETVSNHTNQTDQTNHASNCEMCAYLLQDCIGAITTSKSAQMLQV
jgi:hypothetical protein